MEISQNELKEAMSRSVERDTRRLKFRIPFYVSLKRVIRESSDPVNFDKFPRVGWILANVTLEAIRRHRGWNLSIFYTRAGLRGKPVWGNPRRVKNMGGYYADPKTNIVPVSFYGRFLSWLRKKYRAIV